ncbi:hypothetical protein [Aequorivita sp. KMM 9714]|uniref:hypothetical protein n=1 Tax=Aequorivita sp. KMM 9714 TaxID=2707173 RepID=UPI0013EAC3DA|nr:hypothetical protein [Aequorivita sp. KMM 9714]NGX84358.1 hypothetical protein [Aequorivita sp. KMM 9714]
MNRFLFLLIFSSIFIQSCDDGDIIVRSFNFDNAELKTCGDVGNYVFYKVNPDSKESLSLKMEVLDSLYREEGIANYALNGTTIVVDYRTYDAALGNNYFCSSIPPTSPNVTVEYVASSGTAVLTTTFLIEDNDGVPREFEFAGDTDGDGLDDMYDFDDDGDNVPTVFELNLEDDDEDPFSNPKDTDGDGIPDFLDNDDDNDGVLTRFEDENLDLDPRNDITDPTVGPDYLNPEVANSYGVFQHQPHEYQIFKSVQITLKDLVLVRGDEQIIIETLDMGTIENVEIITKTVTPQP